jgi:hypothetical protein
MSLVLRNVKGSALTFTEMDDNLIYLEELSVTTELYGTTQSVVNDTLKLQFFARVDSANPTGIVEDKGIFYGTASTPTSADTRISQGETYAKIIIEAEPTTLAQMYLDDVEGLGFLYQVDFILVVKDEPVLEPDTEYFFRPFIQFVDNDPSEYIYGPIVSYTTPPPEE